jgi:CPW-WPC domain-containing protein
MYFLVWFLFMHSSVVTSLQIGTHGADDPGSEEDIGVHLGGILKAAHSKVSGDAAQGRVDNLQGMTSQINEDTTALVNPVVDRVVNRANEITAASEVVDPLCTRAWEQNCPDGWAPVGSRCLAPASYRSWGAGCTTFFSWDGASMADKITFSEKCAPWPCAGTCQNGSYRDYDACPSGFTQKSTVPGLCELTGRTKDNQPHCANQYYVSGMTIAQKQELASSCGFQFPCRPSSECDKPDWDAACPSGWAEVGGFCVAPRLYDNICSHGVNTTGMTHVQKIEFAAKCAVVWPCHGVIVSEQMVDASTQGSTEVNGPVDYTTGRVFIVGTVPSNHTEGNSIDFFDTSVPSGAIDARNGDILFEAA